MNLPVVTGKSVVSCKVLQLVIIRKLIKFTELVYHKQGPRKYNLLNMYNLYGHARFLLQLLMASV